MSIATCPDCYRLVQVPPGVGNGFKGVAVYPSLLCNGATVSHAPQELNRMDPHESRIPYDWSRKDA
jgi:hypothetical protein